MRIKVDVTTSPPGASQKKEVKREFNLFKNENFSNPDSLFAVSRYK